MRGLQREHSKRIVPALRNVTILVILLALTTGLVSGGVFLKNGTDVTGNDTLATILADRNGTQDCSVIFFYNTHCGACHLAMAYLNEYNAAHPDLTIESYDLFNSSQNKALFEHYKNEFNRPYVSVPTVYIGNAGLEGESSIREYFDPLVSRCNTNQNASALLPEAGKGAAGKTHRTVISIPLVLIAGIIDGINPCAVAVLIFLLILLMTIRQRQRVMLAGIVFTSAIFFFYFLAGTGIFPISGSGGVVKGFSLIAGVLAILAGLGFILKAFFPGTGDEDREPGEKERSIPDKCNQMAIPAAFIFGLLLGILDLSCAGGIYISILDMIAFRVNIMQGLVYLLLYNLAFIIPLLLMTGIVFLVIKPEEENRENENNKKRGFRIFTGLLLLVFAFLILSGLL